MKKTIPKRMVYASLYMIPEEGKLKSHLIFIVGKNGKLEDYIPGPFTIGEYFGPRLKKRETGMIVSSYLKLIHPHMKIQPGDVRLYSYKKANKLFFQLENE